MPARRHVGQWPGTKKIALLGEEFGIRTAGADRQRARWGLSRDLSGGRSESLPQALVTRSSLAEERDICRRTTGQSTGWIRHHGAGHLRDAGGGADRGPGHDSSILSRSRCPSPWRWPSRRCRNGPSQETHLQRRRGRPPPETHLRSPMTGFCAENLRQLNRR